MIRKYAKFLVIALDRVNYFSVTLAWNQTYQSGQTGQRTVE